MYKLRDMIYVRHIETGLLTPVLQTQQKYHGRRPTYVGGEHGDKFRNLTEP